MLAAPSSEAVLLIPQAAERQNSLQKKGKWRDAKGIAAESCVSALDLVWMPRREKYDEGPTGEAKFDEEFVAWQRKACRARRTQKRTRGQYEKKVGLVNSAMESIGHTPFAEWVQTSKDDEAKGWALTLIMVDGVPRVPSVSAVCEWAFRYAMGEIKKGGSREYRNMPWYGSIGLRGKRQGDQLLPPDKERQFGFGAFADQAPRFVYIEQVFSALRALPLIAT